MSLTDHAVIATYQRKANTISHYLLTIPIACDTLMSLIEMGIHHADYTKTPVAHLRRWMMSWMAGCRLQTITALVLYATLFSESLRIDISDPYHQAHGHQGLRPGIRVLHPTGTIIQPFWRASQRDEMYRPHTLQCKQERWLERNNRPSGKKRIRSVRRGGYAPGWCRISPASI